MCSPGGALHQRQLPEHSQFTYHPKTHLVSKDGYRRGVERERGREALNVRESEREQQVVGAAGPF